jgi:hypothetical protein
MPGTRRSNRAVPAANPGERLSDQHARAVHKLADLERQWDPSPAGRLAAARGWYVRTRDHELY